MFWGTSGGSGKITSNLALLEMCYPILVLLPLKYLATTITFKPLPYPFYIYTQTVKYSPS